jgi:hypothetical protein
MAQYSYKSMFKISRKIFSRLIVWFIPYTIIYAILTLFTKNLTWKFYISSAEVVAIILVLLLVVPGLIIAVFTKDNVEDLD